MITLLEAADLTYRVGRRTLWNAVHVSLAPGEALAVRGPSGSGKSTLLRCLGGLEPLHGGSVTVRGIDLRRASTGARRRLRRDVIGFVMQDHAVVPEWTVSQNLRVVRSLSASRREVQARIPAALLAVGLGGREGDRAGTMSGGEQQRIAVARVLVQRPSLVLADEPTASLDRSSAERVRAGLDALRGQGCAVVVATHDDELAEWCGSDLNLA